MDTNTLLERELAKTQLGEFGLDPSLVLYLPLHQLNGSSFMSRDAFGHIATVTGATWGLQGRTFDGINDYISIANTAAFYNAFDTAWSIEMWVKITATGSNYVLFDKPFTSHIAPYYHIQITDFASDGNKIAVLVLNSAGTSFFTTIIAASVPTLGAWYQIVVTCNKTTPYLELFINNISQGSRTTSSGTYPNYAIGASLGRLNNYDAYEMPGSIGEVRIYSRALTTGEIMRNYRATKWRYT